MINYSPTETINTEKIVEADKENSDSLPLLIPAPLDRFEITKELLKTSMPMAATSLLDTLNNFASGLILSRLKNPNALAISPLVDSTDLTLTIISMAPLYAIGILIREVKGAGQNKDIGGIWQQSMILAIATAIPPMILMKYGLSPIYLFLGQAEELTELVQAYFDAYFWGVIPNALVGCSEQLAFGTDRQSLVFGMRIFELVVLGLSSYVLVFGSSGIPALGVRGLGYAFATQAWLSLIAYNAILFFKEEFAEYGLFSRHPNLTFSVLRKLWSIGWPMAIAAMNDMSSIFAISMLIGRLGKPSLIAQEVSAAYFSIMIEPVFALARTASFLVSEAFGGKRFVDLKKYGNLSLQLGVVFSLLGFIFPAFPKLLASPFIDLNDSTNEDILKILTPLLAVTAGTQVIDAARSITFGALSGVRGDTLIPALIGSAGTWLLGMPFAYYLGFTCDLGLNGLFLGQSIGLFASAAPMLYRWYNRSNNAEIISEKAEESANCRIFNISNYCPSFFATSPSRQSSDANNETIGFSRRITPS